jgi:NADPH-dependent 7-cyano-7-deazaguanine reductase QueF-like protein
MTTKSENIIKSLKELQIYAESCNKDTIEKVSSISSIIKRI